MCVYRTYTCTLAHTQGLGVSVHTEDVVGHLCTPGGGVTQILVLQFTVKVNKALGCRGRHMLSLLSPEVTSVPTNSDRSTLVHH